VSRALLWVFRWFVITVVVCFGVYGGTTLLHRTAWYKERLVGRLFSTNSQEQVYAAMTLARLKCEPELLRVLHADDPTSRELGRRALEHIWFHQAGKDAYRMLEQAHDAMEKKEFQRALAVLDRMIDRYPTFAEAWNRRGAVYWELGNYQQSAADSERALALNPNHYGAMQGIGICRLQMGDVAEACRYLRAALKVLPHDTATRDSLQKCEELLRIFPPPAKRLKSYDEA
jgi:tetratricopeptide (TPR) repeat protein